MTGENRLIIDGGPRRYVFRGKASTEVLPRLLSALDGSCDQRTLRTRLGLSDAQLSQALTLLAGRGLLEDPTPPQVAVPDHVERYLSRNLEVYGSYGGVGALLDMLHGAAVHVIGAGSVARAVADDLRELGVGLVSGGPLDAVGLDRLRQAERGLAVVVDTSGDPTPLEEAVARCGPHGIPVLRLFGDRGHLEIGPCFLPPFTACPACLCRGRQEAGWTGEETLTAAAAEVLSGLGADEAAAVLARSPVMGLPRNVLRLDLLSWTTEEYLVAPDPSCSLCGTGSEWSAVEVFEWSVERPAPSCVRHGEPPASVRKMWRTLAGERPNHSAHPAKQLPSLTRILGRTFGEPSDVAAPRVDESLLSDVILRVGGLREQEAAAPRRWTANAGRLGSVEVHLISPGLPGLPGTVFRYDDLTHRLHATWPDPVSLPEALSGTDLTADGVEAVLVFTAAYDRMVRKYKDFTFRVTHLDAGCAATQLAAVLEGYGLTADFASRWDDRIGKALDLVPDKQYVTAIAALRLTGAEGDDECR